MNRPLHISQPETRSDAPLVLHVRVVAGAGGGPDKTILRSPYFVDSRRIRMAAAYIHPHEDPGMEFIRAQARQWGCPLWEIAEAGALDFNTLRSLVQLCRKKRVTVWHGHDYKSNFLGLLVRRFWPMKLVTTVHGWTRETTRTKLYYHVDNWCLPRYDEVIAVSPLLMRHCTKLGVDPSKLTYLPNGIDENDYQPEGAGPAWRRELGVSDDTFVIGVVGRLSVEKGVDRALRTLAELRQTYPKIELHIIGDGAEYEPLQALTRELKLADAVRFLGWQQDAKRFYEMMNMLLLPSHTEGLPNVVLEAMSMGLPVAATDVGGVRNLLDSGRCGVILSQDESTWAGHIAPLLVSAARRTELARLGRQRIERHYSFSNRMAGEVEVYERVLSIGRASQRRRAA